MPSEQIIFLESGRGLGHVTPTILAVRSAILATAWLLVLLVGYWPIIIMQNDVGPRPMHS